MSEPIKVGDLVVQVHAHCGNDGASEFIGIPWTVESISVADAVCPYCDSEWDNELLAEGIYDGDGLSIPFSWLRKINPPAQETVTWDSVGWQPERVTV